MTDPGQQNQDTNETGTTPNNPNTNDNLTEYERAIQASLNHANNVADDELQRAMRMSMNDAKNNDDNELKIAMQQSMNESNNLNENQLNEAMQISFNDQQQKILQETLLESAKKQKKEQDLKKLKDLFPNLKEQDINGVMQAHPNEGLNYYITECTKLNQNSTQGNDTNNNENDDELQQAIRLSMVESNREEQDLQSILLNTMYDQKKKEDLAKLMGLFPNLKEYEISGMMALYPDGGFNFYVSECSKLNKSDNNTGTNNDNNNITNNSNENKNNNENKTNNDNTNTNNDDDMFDLFFRRNFGDKMWKKYGNNIRNVCDDIEMIVGSDSETIDTILNELNVTKVLDIRMFKRKVTNIQDQAKEFESVFQDIGLKSRIKQKLLSVGIFSEYSLEYTCNGQYDVLLNLIGQHNGTILTKLWNKVYNDDINTNISSSNQGTRMNDNTLFDVGCEGMTQTKKQQLF